MTGPLTDDDLGARLRSALQSVSPLGTDPVPPPRFAPTVAPSAVPDDSADGEVIDIGGPHAPRPSTGRSRRRRALAVGVLAVAAAAVVAVVAVTSEVPTDTRTPAAPPSSGVSSVDPVPSPPTYTGPGVSAAEVPWRCTAPAGSTIAATDDRGRYDVVVWTVAAGVSCVRFPADMGAIVINADGTGVTVPGLAPATFGVSRNCAFVATQAGPTQDFSFVSRGVEDYLEFYGAGCRLVLPAR